MADDETLIRTFNLHKDQLKKIRPLQINKNNIDEISDEI